MRGSLSYCTITQLEQCCQQLDRWDEIHYVNVFVLYNRVLPGTENCLMVQRREEASKPFLDSKTQEERENKEINLINILNPGDPGLVAGGAFSPPSPSQAAPEVGIKEPMAPPQCDEGWVSLSKTHHGTQFG